MKRNNSKRKKKKIIIYSISTIILIIILCSTVFKKEKLISVQTEKSKKRTITQVVTATGKIQPKTEVKIVPEVSGEIIQLNVKLGDVVKKGDLLLKINPNIYVAKKEQLQAQLNSYSAQISLHKANYDKAYSEFERSKKLRTGVLSQSEYENIENAFKAAKAQLASAQHQKEQAQASLKQAEEEITKTEIYSPIDGIIIRLNVEVGERVTGTGYITGTDIMTVADLNVMEAFVDVGENDIVQIKNEQSVSIEVDAYPNKKFKGTVYEIANSAKTTSQGTQEEVVTFQVKISIIDKDIQFRPGLSCTVDIETITKENVVSLPIQSVTARSKKEKSQDEINGDSTDEPKKIIDSKKEEREKGKQFKEVIFIIDNNTVKMNEVKSGISDNEFIEIINGLDEGIEVVTGSYKAINKELEDGIKIEINNDLKKNAGATDK